MRRPSIRAAIVAAVLGLVLVSSAAPAGATAVKGVADGSTFWFLSPPDGQVKYVHDVAAKLSGRYIRFDVYWSYAEPTAPDPVDGHHHYAEGPGSYLGNLRTIVDAADAEGLKVILTLYKVPRWASDSSFWDSPPPVYGKGYQPFYPPTAEGREAFGAFAQYLANSLAGKVWAYECWNEPNLWAYLYPQQTAGDDDFSAHTYKKLLVAFHDSITAGDPLARVIAGATAPMGEDGGVAVRYRTSPQRFAAALKSAGAEPYFDAYSHHPYVPGGSGARTPEDLPGNTKTTVSLSNLGTLLKIYPDKPFYLTEYGYNTAFAAAFGGFYVNQIDQASYLKRAYRRAGKYPQVKMMLWYLIKDWSPTGRAGDANGLYTGLRDIDGRAKRAWYAFAGGNRIAISAPTSIRRGQSATLSGRLTCATVGGVKGKPLVLLRYRPGRGWRSVRTVTTGSGGYYRTRVAPTATTTYRFSWRGVVMSATRKVRVY